MLETIYEIDEDFLRDEETSKSGKEQSRLSIYMCWCMITGCFLILAFIILISLNPQYLLNQATSKHTKNIINISLHSNEKFELSADIINYLGIFAHEVNKPADLQGNTIGFLTSPVSNSSFSQSERVNRNGILWIYGYVKYPQSCLSHATCKEHWRVTLTGSFDELSNSMKTIDLNSRQNRQIRLDWCTLLENLTSAAFVALASSEPVSQNPSDPITPFDPLICEDLDPIGFRSKTLADLISQEGIVFINTNPHVENGANDTLTEKSQNEEPTCRDPAQCVSSQRQETAHCPNDASTQYLLITNSF